MFGPNWDQVMMNQQLGYQALPEPNPDTDGVIPRVIANIFDRMQDLYSYEGIKFNFMVSFV